MNYSDMKVTDLRKAISSKGLARGIALAYASKEDLIKLLNGEITSLPSPSKMDNTPVKEEKNEVAEDDDSKAFEAMKTLMRLSSKGATLDEDGVKRIISEFAHSDEMKNIISENSKKVVKEIHLPSKEVVEIEERTHKAFERVLKIASIGLPVLLVGPAGTGKTHLASQIAKALNLPFTFNSMSAGVTESHLVGRLLPEKDGSFKFHYSPFVETWKNGGVHLFDELDASDPNVMTFLNSALANGKLSVPQSGEVIEKNPNTVIICAANTYGHGANRQYVGRNALDAATLDRFSVSTVEIDYDEDLENNLDKEISGDTDVSRVFHEIRKVVEDNGLRRIVSTRTIINASKMVAQGLPMEWVFESFLAGWSKDEKAKVATIIKE